MSAAPDAASADALKARGNAALAEGRIALALQLYGEALASLPSAASG